MNESNSMTVEQEKAFKKSEFNRIYGRYWFIYAALFMTAIMSTVSGLLLPFRPDSNGQVVITWGLILAAAYYAVGFLITGEGASYFWFDKLTDQDPDNGWQTAIAYLMLGTSVITSLITALSAASFIAYWLGVMPEFSGMPGWAQKWVVWAIPSMFVSHFIAGTIFKAISNESAYERRARSTINKARAEMAQARAQAKADWWKANAPEVARALGQMEAQAELNAQAARLAEQQPQTAPLPVSFPVQPPAAPSDPTGRQR